MRAIDLLEDHLENEINFHREAKFPWYHRAVDRVLRRNSPRDVLVWELDGILRYLRELKEMQKRGELE